MHPSPITASNTRLMLRINVTGNAGAGKSTLAQRIGGVLDVPVFSLDSIVWKPGWQKTPPEERRLLEEAIIEHPAWIIDGVSERVRAASDLVIFLDVPRHICVRRGIGRSLRYFFRPRPGLPERCPEWRILPRLMRIIWQFPMHAGKAIRQEAVHAPNRYRIVGRSIDAQSPIAGAVKTIGR